MQEIIASPRNDRCNRKGNQEADIPFLFFQQCTDIERDCKRKEGINLYGIYEKKRNNQIRDPPFSLFGKIEIIEHSRQNHSNGITVDLRHICSQVQKQRNKKELKSDQSDILFTFRSGQKPEYEVRQNHKKQIGKENKRLPRRKNLGQKGIRKYDCGTPGRT